jgi:hypothetical protein
MMESEAKTKWCPFTRFHVTDSGDVYSNRLGGDTYATCLGSACMAWRATDNETPPWDGKTGLEPRSQPAGYCGMARGL